MNRNKACMWTGILMVALLVGLAGGARAELKWNCQAIFPAGSSLYKEFVAFTEKIKVMSNGELVITPHPVGAIVGYKDMHGALQTGVLQAYFSAPTFQAGKEPAFSLFADLPGGYENVMQFYAWYYQKGGLQMLQDAHAKWKNHCVGVIFYGREVLPAKVVIRTAADLKGKKIRAAEGIIADLMTALGASTVSIPGSEVYSALDKGVIEASDWGTRSMNDQMGLYEVCKFSIEPGFHSMSALEFVVAGKQWDSLSDNLKQILESATREWSWNTVTRVMKEDAEIGPKLKQMGVEIVSFPKQDYQTIRGVARELWMKWAEKSPLTKQVVDSQVQWCKELGLLE
ncbi:MAG: TRAP transporter substrate-binding protein DctP [Desulfobacterales bacterium]|nr:MAG: TRAP transporter substrate-binding protein DctP [Desulfobacterales bacterium]